MSALWGAYEGEIAVFEENRQIEAEKAEKLSNIAFLGRNSGCGEGGRGQFSLNFGRFLKNNSAESAESAAGFGGFLGFW